MTSFRAAGRPAWLSALALCRADILLKWWTSLDTPPAFQWIRRPTTGAIMVRGVADGQRFNLGDMTVSRCTLKLESGTVGIGYVAGRNQRHVAIIAVGDALLQEGGAPALQLESLLIAEDKVRTARRSEALRQAWTSKVDFGMWVQEAEDPS